MPAVLSRSAVLDIVRDVAPEEVAGDPVPGWAFRSHATCPELRDGGSALKVLVEVGRDGQDGGLGSHLRGEPDRDAPEPAAD